jgi:Cu-processing system permease protein
MMAVARTVATFQARDVVRSRWFVAYVAFFWLVTEGLMRFAGGDAGAFLSLSSIVLYVVPLVAVVFGTIYIYNAREFTELLLGQPIGRRALYLGLYGGLTGPLCLAIILGIGAPVLLRGLGAPGQRMMVATVIGAGVALTLIFTAVAFCIGLLCTDRLRGLGTAIGAWMLGAILYDGFVMAGVAAFSDYPVERAMLLLSLANPIDLARITLLLQFDVSALMGYTGAVFQQFLGTGPGALVAAGALALWIIAPAWFGMRTFATKDF